MNNNVIHYIGFYGTNENEELRNYSPAAKSKMDYICKALNSFGFKVVIVSPSKTTSNHFYKGKIIRLTQDIQLKLFPTIPWGNKLQKISSIFLSKITLFWYLLTKIKRGETILVYHSLELINIIRLAKKIKKFKVILELEEIYQDVMDFPEHVRKGEYNTIEEADKYLFPTELLNEKVNLTNKPYAVAYGTYHVEKLYKSSFDDDKVHIVYAGTFDPRKGIINAISIARYLPSNYHVHIIGFGSEEQVRDTKERIAEVSKKSEAAITYDGLMKGEEYNRFLQKCHIGLSTQQQDAKYNNTSFPSKVLSYMANGLRVVSVRMKVVERAEIGGLIYYYDESDPQSIARTILSIDMNKPYDSRNLIEKLDKRFKDDIKRLLEN